jgi:hypothetical protein
MSVCVIILYELSFFAVMASLLVSMLSLAVEKIRQFTGKLSVDNSKKVKKTKRTSKNGLKENLEEKFQNTSQTKLSESNCQESTELQELRCPTLKQKSNKIKNKTESMKIKQELNHL